MKFDILVILPLAYFMVIISTKGIYVVLILALFRGGELVDAHDLLLDNTASLVSIFTTGQYVLLQYRYRNTAGLVSFPNFPRKHSPTRGK